jgi:hypothetical protein
MPTPIPAPEKTAVLDRIKVLDPVEADKLSTILVNYEDVLVMVGRSLPVFEYKNSYLAEVISQLNTNQLQTVGIFYNIIGPIGNDPRLIIDCTVTGGATVINTSSNGLGILGNSVVDVITVAAGKVLRDLWVGPGSKLTLLDSTAAGAFVNTVFIRNLRSAPAELSAIKFGSNVGSVKVDPGAIYGDIQSVTPGAACAIPVTALAATDVTYNTVKLGWTAPAGNYLVLNVYYKKTESGVWLLASEKVGDFITDGFIFRSLEKDTKYDFKVSVTCINGGIADDTLSQVTTCC